MAAKKMLCFTVTEVSNRDAPTCPEYIKVFGRDWKLRWVDRAFYTAVEAFGEMLEENSEILVWEGTNSHHKAEILIHEVRHSIHSMMGLEDSNTEEQFTAQGSVGEAAVWRDNPELYCYISYLLFNPRVEFES